MHVANDKTAYNKKQINTGMAELKYGHQTRGSTLSI